MPKRPNDARDQKTPYVPTDGTAKDPHEAWLRFAEIHQLTEAELRAVQLLVTDNFSDKQIAAALGRSRADAIKHLQNVRAKLRVHNRGAIINAFRQFEVQWLQGNAPNTPP